MKTLKNFLVVVLTVFCVSSVSNSVCSAASASRVFDTAIMVNCDMFPDYLNKADKYFVTDTEIFTKRFNQFLKEKNSSQDLLLGDFEKRTNNYSSVCYNRYDFNLLENETFINIVTDKESGFIINVTVCSSKKNGTTDFGKMKMLMAAAVSAVSSIEDPEKFVMENLASALMRDIVFGGEKIVSKRKNGFVFTFGITETNPMGLIITRE